MTDLDVDKSIEAALEAEQQDENNTSLDQSSPSKLKDSAEKSKRKSRSFATRKNLEAVEKVNLRMVTPQEQQNRSKIFTKLLKFIMKRKY